MGNRIFYEHSFHSLGQMDEKLELVLRLTVGQVQLKVYVYAIYIYVIYVKSESTKVNKSQQRHPREWITVILFRVR